MEFLNEAQFPSGREQGVVVLVETASAFARRVGREFSNTEDSLGSLKVLHARLDSGSHVSFTWRPDKPSEGVAVVADDEDNPHAIAFELVAELSLNEGDVAWLTPRLLWTRTDT